MTVPQVRKAIAHILHTACRCDTPEWLARDTTRRLQRNQLATLSHWKRRNHLPPLNVDRRRM